MNTFFTILIGAILVNNIVLTQFLGICPFIGVSKKVQSALGMGIAVTFVIALSCVATYMVYNYVLIPLNLVYLKTIVFIFIIAGLVQITEILIKHFAPKLFNALGIYLPLITTNCTVLGTALTVTSQFTNIFTAFFYGLCTGLGFTLAIVLLAGIRIKFDMAYIPKPFRGLPIALIAAAIMSMAFGAFTSII
ncbi:MAG: RnfABCDGE type electron transport complex subunit A [Clostridia bacterium]|jgi:electron transport complex protein RnfA|nr:RnfABCDGE type electron transport complex subunit A [Clostridia bacterium]